MIFTTLGLKQREYEHVTGGADWQHVLYCIENPQDITNMARLWR